jgi:hypothetical protein
MREVGLQLSFAGYTTYTVRSRDKAAKKARDLGRFQDPANDASAIITNINILSTGINLQKSCNRGVLLNLSTNAALIDQIFGRLHRIGQKKEVI